MTNRVLYKGEDGTTIIKWKGLLYIRYPQTKKFERVSEEVTYTTCMSIKHVGARWGVCNMWNTQRTTIPTRSVLTTGWYRSSLLRESLLIYHECQQGGSMKNRVLYTNEDNGCAIIVWKEMTFIRWMRGQTFQPIDLTTLCMKMRSAIHASKSIGKPINTNTEKSTCEIQWRQLCVPVIRVLLLSRTRRRFWRPLQTKTSWYEKRKCYHNQGTSPILHLLSQKKMGIEIRQL